MFPASDPLLFIGSLLHSCVFPPSVLSNGDNKGDCRRIYLNNDMSGICTYVRNSAVRNEFKKNDRSNS
jgi:hypothetical protein